MIDLNTIYNEDCLTGMERIEDKSVDMILCDLPYGTTACRWDVIIPLEPLWRQYERIIKDNGAIVLTASQPFTSMLVMSNLKMFKYSLVWSKSKITGYFEAKNKPMRKHEDILVFSKGNSANGCKNRITYNPQGLQSCMATRKNYPTESYGERSSRIKGAIYIQKETNYPTSLLDFPNDHPSKSLHSTQKPVALFEYLIKTYTNEGETVLDNCMGSCTTAIACINTGRNYIGFEKDEKIFQTGANRVKEHLVKRKNDLFAA